jgi:DNA polymerase/3'-5' exonuclease PolX
VSVDPGAPPTPRSNAEAAEQLRRIADLLDVLGERFKPEAYRRAARSIDGLGEELVSVAGRNELGTIPGVGEAIAEKLREYLRDGRIPYLERLEREIPPGVVQILRLEGLGPKTARRFWTELGVTGADDLRVALDAGRLDGLKGFGPRKIELLRASLGAAPPAARLPLWEAAVVGRALVEGLRARAPVDRIELAGSYRRGRETVGDLDLLVLTPEPSQVFDAFGTLPEVASVRLRGDTKETVLLRSGLQVDLRIVPAVSFGAALQYFTGSKDHNVRLRSRARDLGLKVNEYAVTRGEEAVAGATEEEVYGILGLAWVPPELREDRGEIEAAEQRALPTLLDAEGLGGELHVHLPTHGSVDSARQLVAAARAGGACYLGLLAPPEVGPAERAQLRALGDATFAVGLGCEDPLEQLRAPLPEGLDYRLVTGAGAPAPPVPGPHPPGRAPSLAVVHLALQREGSADADPARSLPWIRWAAACSLGLEVTAHGSREGLDSVSARSARELGVPLLVSGVGPDGPDRLRRQVALAFARRSGAGPDDVVNGLEPPWRPKVPRPAETPRRSSTRAATPGRSDGPRRS